VARTLSADSITLTIPHAKPFHSVARLVVGGLAARLELSYEHLEDLQLALESVLASESVMGEEVTVDLVVDESSVVMRIGPLDPNVLADDLAADTAMEVSLSRLLATLVEEVSVEQGDGGQRLRLEKRVPMTKPESRAPE
jgi:hypothetical protein